MVLPVVLMVLLIAAGVTAAVLPVDAGSHSCGRALSVERGASLPQELDAVERKDCHDKAHASVEVGAITVALALVGIAGSGAAVRSAR